MCLERAEKTVLPKSPSPEPSVPFCRSRALAAALVFAVLGLCPSAAWSQVSAVRAQSVTEGAAVPAPISGAALSRGALSPGVNPAGLGGFFGAEATYLHDRNVPRDRIGDVLAGAAGIGPVSFGLSEHWMRFGGEVPDYRKTSLTLAAGSRLWGIGTSLNFYASPDSRSLDRLVSWDVGAVVRPASFISVGAAAMDLNAPRLDGARLARRFGVGLGFRPGTDRVEIGADWRFDDLSPLEDSRLEFVLRGEVVGGVLLSAGFSTSASGKGLAGQIALALRTERFGAGYAFGAHLGGVRAAEHTAWVSASSARQRGMSLPRKHYVLLDVEAAFRTGRGLSGLLGRQDGWLALMAQLDRIAQDDSAAGVVVKLEGSGALGLAQAEALNAGIARLRQSGKKAVALLLGAEDPDYLAALACDRIVAVPAANLFINGFRFHSTFFGRLLDKAGVTMDVARSGRFKTAPDEFTASGMSDAEKEQLDAALDVIFPRYVRAIAAARGMTEEAVRAALDVGVTGAGSAKDRGLVDEVVFTDQVGAVVSGLEHGRTDLTASEEAEPDVPQPWGLRPKIALIRIDGLIVSGSGGGGLFGMGRRTGAADVLEALRRAVFDGSVKAVVLAIDSGGGSSLASDLIWRFVRLAAQEKPVVVSMGNVAASGGYYIASAGTEILASPSTLTGSIGVFIMKPSFQGLMDRAGVDSESLERGQGAGLMSLARPWSESEKAAVQRAVDEAYGLFLERVAEGRKMPKSKVETLAAGRVWLGSDAVANGLADRLGGLSEAIQRAAVLAGLEHRRTEVVLFDGSGLGSRVREVFQSGGGDRAPLSKLAELLGAGAADILLDESGHPLAVVPWEGVR